MSELIIFRCKKCNNELPINSGVRVTLFCQHCGNKELIPDEDIVLKCIFCEQEFYVKKNEPNKNRNKCHQSRQAGGNSLLFEVKAKSQEPATLKPKVIDGDSSNKDKSVLNRIIDKFNKKLNNIPASDNKTKILDLEYDDIKKALGQRNDGFLISVVEGYLSGFKKFNTELVKEACKKLNLNYRLITFKTEKLKTKDLAIINVSDLVICQPNIYIENIIKLRVPTIIIHTPCDKEYKNLTSHVLAAHKMDMDKYKQYNPDKNSNKISVTQDELQKERFSIKDKSDLLSVFLEEFEITEKELRTIVKSYKGKGVISATQQVKNNMNIGKNGAKDLAEQDRVETEILYIAEDLVKSYNFTVVEVRSGPPKLWILEK